MTAERPMIDPSPRHDWTTEEILAIHDLPLMDLVFEAQRVHRAHHAPEDIQRASLLSIKTGGCPENCAYCPQSAHHKEVGMTVEPLMPVEDVLHAARRARDAGATRFCMGAAWRQVKDGPEFDNVVAMVEGVRALDMEACVTLGMLERHQAARLAKAGLTAYNHNIDTSPEYYSEIITTRTFEDRIETLGHVRGEGIELCCGGIVGMGESIRDRARMIEVLARMNPHPESVPINSLVAVDGTPLAHAPPLDPIELVRMIALARITMPKARVRLSAGRRRLGKEAQILCFLAGANSIFYGEKLLTTENNDADDDLALLAAAGAARPAAAAR